MTAIESKTHPVWETLRLRHWIKNSFIFAPALFTLKAFDPTVLPDLMAGFFGFSLVASAVYTFNDLCDRAEDRLHPIKQYRPIASGRLGTGTAIGMILILLLIGVGLLGWFSLTAALVALIYAILMGLYSLFLRRVLILDVIIIGAGFVLRVIAGGLLVAEPVSHWLLLCTFTIALFMGMIKRRQELQSKLETDPAASLKTADVTEESSRSVLADYPHRRVIDSWIAILAGMTVLCYALYTVDPQTVVKHHTGALIYTLPLVLYGVFRYMQLAFEGRTGEDPTNLVLNDMGMKVVVLMWLVAVSAILFIGSGGT